MNIISPTGQNCCSIYYFMYWLFLILVFKENLNANKVLIHEALILLSSKTLQNQFLKLNKRWKLMRIWGSIDKMIRRRRKDLTVKLSKQCTMGKCASGEWPTICTNCHLFYFFEKPPSKRNQFKIHKKCHDIPKFA